MPRRQGINNPLPPIVSNLSEILQQLTLLTEQHRNLDVPQQVFYNSALSTRNNALPRSQLIEREVNKPKTRRKPRKKKTKEESEEASTSRQSFSSNSSASASPLKNRLIIKKNNSKKNLTLESYGQEASTSRTAKQPSDPSSYISSSKIETCTFSIRPGKIPRTSRFIRKRTSVTFVNLRSFLDRNSSRFTFQSKSFKKAQGDSTQELDKAQSRKYPKRESRRLRKKKELEKESHEFPNYFNEQEVKNGLFDGSLIKGAIRINIKNVREAYVNNQDPTCSDYVIMSVTDRNRAFEGDEVVLQIKPKEQWIGDNKTARVVCVKQKVHPRQAVGSLKPVNPEEGDYAIFVPRDKRFPVMRISQLHWPNGFKEHPKEFDNILLLAKLIEWTVPAYANGIIIEKLGQSGNLKIENLSIIRECHLDISPFSDDLKKFLPNFLISEKEYENREDLRKKCIFTIDPATARDLDDAVSVELLSNGNYEVGVHISDASFFLAEGTELDQIVSKKATTIYMVDSVYHMLPLEMCIGCSLLPGQDKLSFSVFWEMTPNAEVVSKRFTRSIMNSCVKLAYEHAQMVIECPTEYFDASDFPEIHNGFKPQDIVNTINILQSLAKILRENRFKNGALRIDNLKLSFDLDPATGEPMAFSVYQNAESHRLIEEFMLLANISVAQKIFEAFPEVAFLRCHEPPKLNMLHELNEKLALYGIHMDTSSAGAIQASLNKYRTDDDAGYARAIALNHLTSRTMTRAKYFCASEAESERAFKHYALSVPIYTHFTSPIRRYADIMVHRLLAASLDYREQPVWDTEYVEAIAKNCNTQKYQAKKAQDASMELYLAHFIEREKTIQECVVVDVKEKRFDVVVLKTGTLIRIRPQNCGKAATWEYERNKLTINFRPTRTQPKVSLTIELLSVIRVHLTRKDKESYHLDGKPVRPKIGPVVAQPKRKKVKSNFAINVATTVKCQN